LSFQRLDSRLRQPVRFRVGVSHAARTENHSRDVRPTSGQEIPRRVVAHLQL
jgi:hypothetical protein